MDLYSCNTPLGGQNLVEHEKPPSPATPWESNTQIHTGSPKQRLPRFPVLESHSPDKQLDAAQVDEALRLVSRWIHQGYDCTTLRQEQKSPFDDCTTPQTAEREENRTTLSKGAARIKTWVKGGRYGPMFRVRRRLDSGHDVVTHLQFLPHKAGKRVNEDDNTLTSPLLSEMDTTEQQIYELPAASSTYELASEHHSPPSYSSIDAGHTEEQHWQQIEVPAVAAAVGQEVDLRADSDAPASVRALESPRATAQFHSGVTRLKSATNLLHKLKEGRERCPTPCLEEEDDDSPYNEAEEQIKTTSSRNLEGELQHIDNDRVSTLDSIWETLLVRQIFIVGENHPLVVKAKQEFESSKRMGHQKSNSTESLRESYDLAILPLGLINPVLIKFLTELQELESLLRENAEGPTEIETSPCEPSQGITDFPSDLPLQDIAMMMSLTHSTEKSSTAPVTPIDRAQVPVDSSPYASESQEMNRRTEVDKREEPLLRISRSLPSLRMPSDAGLSSLSQERSIREETVSDSKDVYSSPAVPPISGENPTAASQSHRNGVEGEVEDDSASLETIGQVMRHRQTTRHLFPLQTHFEPRSRPDGKSAAKTFSHPLLRSLLELIRQGTNALQHASGTEPIPHGHVRIHWRCVCGADLHDDSKELRPGAAEELEAQLNGIRTHSSNSNSNSNSTTSSPSTTSPNSSSASSIFSPPSSSAPSSATTWSTNNSASNSPSRTKSIQILPSPPKTFSIPMPERNPPYLLTCVNEGRFAPKLTHLDMGTDKIANDKDLAMALRTHYSALNDKWYRHFRLRGLTMVDFFQVHKNRFADIRKRPDMPNSTNSDYVFTPDLVPPIGSNCLIHLLKHPQEYEDENTVYERIPKRTSRLATGECGWGVELVETFLPDRVWGLVLCVFGIGSLIFGVVWGVAKRDVQGAFGVAAWVCAFASLVVAWLQACWGR